LVTVRYLELRAPDHIFGSVEKYSTRRGAQALSFGIPTHDKKYIEFQSFDGLEIRKLIYFLFYYIVATT